MSWMIIYLGLSSPTASSDPPESEPGRLMAFFSVLLRMRFTWLPVLPPARQSLTLPFHPYGSVGRSLGKQAFLVTRHSPCDYVAICRLARKRASDNCSTVRPPHCLRGISLLHCLGSCLRQTLSGILPCEARTFLSHALSSAWQRSPVLLKAIFYHKINFLQQLLQYQT